MKFVCLTFFTLIIVSCSEKRASVKPHFEELIESVYSSVSIVPNDAYVVHASVSGYLEEIKLKEGKLVSKGDLLFCISNQPSINNEKNASLALKLFDETYKGESNLLKEMKINLRSSELKKNQDSINFLRYNELFNKGVCSSAEFENAKLVYQVSKNSFVSLITQIARKEIELKNQLQQANYNLKNSALKTSDYLIRSEINGRIYQMNKQVGEFVTLQEPLALIGDAENFTIELLIDEVDISKVALGQKVLVTLEAYKNQVFDAVLTEISPKMDDRNQTFKIKARFFDKPKRLFMGLTGEANIVVNEKRKALVIPREYLLSSSEVITENGRVKVKTGLSDWDFIEIISGIDDKTTIYKTE